MAIIASRADAIPTAEFTEFARGVRARAKAEWRRGDAVRVEGCLALLFEITRYEYQGSIKTMVQQASRAEENIKISVAIAGAYAKQGALARSTLSKNASLLRRVLLMLDFPVGFVASLRLLPAAERKHNKTFGKYGSLAAEHPTRRRLESWAEIVRNSTRNQSELSVRNLISFYVNSCLPALNLDLDQWPADVAAHVNVHLASDPNALRSAIGQLGDVAAKTTRLRIFLKDIL